MSVQGTEPWTAEVQIYMQFIVRPIRTSIGRGLKLVSAKEHSTYGEQLIYPERMSRLEPIVRSAAIGKSSIQGENADEVRVETDCA